MVIDISEYRQLRGGGNDFKEFLLTAPDLAALNIERSTEPARVVDLGEVE